MNNSGSNGSEKKKTGRNCHKTLTGRTKHSQGLAATDVIRQIGVSEVRYYPLTAQSDRMTPFSK